MDQNSRIIELEQKVKQYQLEISKRDELIQQLSSMDIGILKTVIESNETKEDGDEMRLKREDHAKLRAKVDELCEKTLSQEAEIRAKSNLLTKLESENLILKSKISDLTAEIQTKKSEIDKIQQQADILKSEKSRIQTDETKLNKLLQDERQKVKDLTDRLNLQIQGKEQCEINMKKAEESLNHFVTQMINIFNQFAQVEPSSTDIWKDERKLKSLLSQAAKIMDENLKSRGQINELMERIKKQDGEIAERDRTVNRLGEQITQTSFTDKTSMNLSQQLEYCQGSEKALQDRARGLTNDLVDAQVRIRELERQLARVVCENEHVNYCQHDVIKREHSMFCETLASMLSCPRYICSPTEIAIKEHIRRIVTENKEHKELCARLESRLSETLMRLEDVQIYKNELEHSNERAERENIELHERLRRLETATINSDLIKQEHRSERQKLFLYLCKLASKVKIDEQVASRMNFDELQEVLLTRLCQINSGEYSLLSDIQANSDRINSLNRKLKRLQDQLASREIQLGLWKEKATKLENQLANLDQIEAQAQSNKLNAEKAHMNSRRAELEAARLKDELARIKAELLDYSDAKIKAVKAEEDLISLAKANEELESIRIKQTAQINELLAKLETCEAETQAGRIRADDEFGQMVEDLQSTRKTVEQLSRSETELLEFRAVVARLLGLDMEILTVPNYEIISQLEQLIHQYHQIDPASLIDDRIQSNSGPRSPLAKPRSVQIDRMNYPESGDYIAGPNIARARSKQAWLTKQENHSRLVGKSSHDDKPNDKTLTVSAPAYERLNSPMKRDPRKY